MLTQFELPWSIIRQPTYLENFGNDATAAKGTQLRRLKPGLVSGLLPADEYDLRDALADSISRTDATGHALDDAAAAALAEQPGDEPPYAYFAIAFAADSVTSRVPVTWGVCCRTSRPAMISPHLLGPTDVSRRSPKGPSSCASRRWPP